MERYGSLWSSPQYKNSNLGEGDRGNAMEE